MRLSRSASSSNARRQSSSEQRQRAGIRVVVVGDGGVGKTCLLSRFVNHTFPLEYIPTVFENHHTELLVDGTSVSLEIWDTAGQEEYAMLRQKSYSADVDVFLVVFAVDNRDSFENVFATWLKEVKRHCPRSAIVVVGNKSDLREDDGVLAEAASYGKPVLDFDVYKTRCFDAQVESYMECSALDESNVLAVFEEVVRVDRRLKLSMPSPPLPARASRKESCIIL